MLSSTIAGFGRDFASGKISERINELVEKSKGQHDDVVLSESLRELIREKYGDEMFYNDLDSFITRDRVCKCESVAMGIQNCHVYRGMERWIKRQ